MNLLITLGGEEEELLWNTLLWEGTGSHILWIQTPLIARTFRCLWKWHRNHLAWDRQNCPLYEQLLYCLWYLMHLGTHLDHCYDLSLVSPKEYFLFLIATNSIISVLDPWLEPLGLKNHYNSRLQRSYARVDGVGTDCFAINFSLLALTEFPPTGRVIWDLLYEPYFPIFIPCLTFWLYRVWFFRLYRLYLDTL